MMHVHALHYRHPRPETDEEGLTPYEALIRTQERSREADEAERETVAALAHRMYGALLSFLGCDNKKLVMGIMILPERQTYYDFMLLLRLDDGLELRLTMRIQPGDPFEMVILTEEGNPLSRCAFPPPSETTEEAARARAEATTQCFSDFVASLRGKLEHQVRTWTEKRAIY